MTRSFRHWTPRYVADRVAVALNERTHPDWPWLTRDAVHIIGSLLRPKDVGIEFGSGRSTLWFARQCRQLTSIESSAEWYERVAAMLSAGAVTNVTLLHRVQPDYAKTAADAADASLDFALVDGIARDACSVALAPKLKAGGFLVIDNINWYVPSVSRAPASQRTRYATPIWEQAFEHDFAAWRRIWTTNGVTDTLILLKP